MELLAVAILPFVLSLIYTLSLNNQNISRPLQTTLNVLVLLVGFGLLASEFSTVEADGFVEYSLAWVPELGLHLTFYLDGLSLLFGLIVTGVGAAIFFYAGYYFDDLRDLTRFNMLLMLFTGAMLGLVLAGNVIMLFIMWELTSIVSFLLISFKGRKYEAARSGAMQALVITGVGGLALIAGLALLAVAAGNGVFTPELSDLLTTKLADHPWYNGIAILLMIAAFTKSAQFPFHFWLPGAMSAPTPASAFLHSATMVKAGVYLMARFYPVLADNHLWTWGLMGTGGATMLIASLFAIKQRDLKGMLAYTTITQLGILIFLLGMPDYTGYKAAIIGILAHALYKAALFLCVGSLDHAYGTRIIDNLGGVARRMPITTGVAVISALSMAGFPFLFGFVAKEVLIAAAMDTTAQAILTGLVFVTGALMTTSSLILIWDVFFRNPSNDQHFHAVQPATGIGPSALATGSLAFGFLLDPLIIPLVTPAIPKPFELKLFPGFHAELFVSLSAIAFGTVIFASRAVWLLRFPSLPVNGSQLYCLFVDGINKLGDAVLWLQGGKLRYYLASILGVLAVVLFFSGLLGDLFQSEAIFPERAAFDNTAAIEIMLVVLAVGAAVTSVVVRRHLYAVLALGVMGYAVAGIFFIEHAPDVALVQFMVETLTTVLVFIILGRTRPQLKKMMESKLWEGNSQYAGVIRDAFIATIIGLCVFVFTLIAMTNRPDRATIADWYVANAEAEAGVPDIVSAVLTDFRGTDTIFEIAVFAMAALGILALISITGDEVTENLNPDRNGNHPLATPFVKFGTYAFLPISLMIATIHVLYGAKAPGDGFTSGVIAGLGIASWYIVFGYSATKQRIQWFKEFRFLSLGLALAFVNALFPLLAGENFLQLLELEDVSFAGLHLSTTLIFEIAIALTVFGSVGIMLEALAKPKRAEKLGGGVSYDDSDVDDGHYESDPEDVIIHHTEELISTPEQ